MWTLGCIMGIGSMFSLYRFYEAPFTNFESSLYAGLHKLVWNLASGWLVLAVTTGHGGWVQRMLSSRVFVPFSRLTYCAYLCNGIVELHNTSNVRTADWVDYIQFVSTQYMTMMKFGWYSVFPFQGNATWSHTTNTFTLGFLLCLVFESPIHALERILMRHFISRNVNKPKNTSSDDITPSTSEEQVA